MSTNNIRGDKMAKIVVKFARDEFSTFGKY